MLITTAEKADIEDIGDSMRDFLLQDIHANLQVIDDLVTSDNPHI